MKKHLLVFQVLIFFITRVHAQTCTAVPVITLNASGVGPIGAYMMVTYNPIKNLYYWNAGGYGSNPIATYGPGGGNTLAVAMGNQDWRGLWWNSNTNKLEGNCFNSNGIFNVSTDPVSGYALPGSTIVAANQQPGSQSGGQYDPVNDQVIYYSGALTVSKYSRSTGSLVATVTITGLPGGTGNISPFGFYTGLAGQEYAIYDYTNRRAYYINYNTGAYVSTVQFPPSAGAPANYALSYANGLFFIYDNGNWIGYRAGIRAYHNGPICIGGSATITAEGSPTYSWSTGATSPSISVSPGTNSTYVVTGTYSAGCVSTVSVALTVFQVSQPTLSVSGNTLICGTGTNVLTASGADTYSWSNGITTASAALSPSVTNSYSVTGTNSVGCSAAVCTTIQVVQPPSLSINGNTSICSGQQVNLSASGANSYTWSTGAITASISENPTVSTTYSVVGTGSMSCSSTLSIAVIVHTNPVLSINGTLNICSGQSTTLTASGASTYSWSNGAQAAAIVVSPSVNTTYSVIGTSSAGCSSSESKTVVVSTSPTLSISGGETPVCEGSAVTLTASGADSFTWANGAQTSTITLTPNASTVISVSGNSINNTCPGNAAVSITVYPNPVVSISGNNTICLGQTTTLSANGANTYSWNIGAGGNSITVNPTVTTSYTATGVSAAGCVGTATIEVFVTICTSVSEINDDRAGVIVYPNPNSGTFKITLNNVNDFTYAEIYNSSGALIQKTEIESENRIDLADATRGLYFVLLKSPDGENLLLKIIKQ